jgi:hypothetical protein
MWIKECSSWSKRKQMASPALDRTDSTESRQDQAATPTSDRPTAERIYTTTYSGRTEVDVDKLLDRQQEFMAEVSGILERYLSNGRKSARK